MRGDFFRRFFRAVAPAFEQQRPERQRPRNDEQPKSPRTMRSMWINFPHTDKCERNSEYKSAREIGGEQYQENGGNHGLK